MSPIKEPSKKVTWIEQVTALEPGDECEWRPTTKDEWRRGTVIRNGGAGFWYIETEQREQRALYAEYIKAVNGVHYSDVE